MHQQTLYATSPEGQNGPACRHHWVIQPALGPVSEGVCRNCGQVRQFKNYVQAPTWSHPAAGGGEDGAGTAAEPSPADDVADDGGEEDEE